MNVVDMKLKSPEFKLASRAQRYADEMRANLALMNKSRVIEPGLHAAAKRECLHYLDKGFFIYPHTFRQAGLNPSMSLDEKKQALGLNTNYFESDENVRLMDEKMQSAAAKTRQHNWEWRIGAEMEDMQELGWYPFFVTLTLDPQKVFAAGYESTQEFWSCGKPFKRYKRDVLKVVTNELGHKECHKSNVPEKEYMRYFGVIEHGKTRNHHHMHLLIWLREIPAEWKRCPNRGIRNPLRRNRVLCKPFESLWPWSNTYNRKVMYFRHLGDVWSKLGFANPMIKKKGSKKLEPLVPHPANKAGGYVTKYMQKDEKEWHHRPKVTRGLGLNRINHQMLSLTMAQLTALTWRPRSYNLNTSLTMTHIVPLGLIRYVAKLRLFQRSYLNRTLNFQAYLQENSGAYQAMRSSVEDGARPHLMDSQALYEWVSEHLPVPEGYCEQRLLDAHMAFMAEDPVTPKSNAKKLGGLAA